MCGIAGIVRFDGAPVEPGVISEMVARLRHRGPDDNGAWIDGSVGFGHTRLSIIDVAGSPQPMASFDERLHLTFNGEILNYRELRAPLDYPFRTNGDTEVLVALHHAHGDTMVRHCAASSRSRCTIATTVASRWRATTSAFFRCTGIETTTCSPSRRK